MFFYSTFHLHSFFRQDDDSDDQMEDVKDRMIPKIPDPELDAISKKYNMDKYDDEDEGLKDLLFFILFILY